MENRENVCERRDEAANTVQDLAPALPLCRSCRSPLSHPFVDLGMSPLCQSHIEPHELNNMERFYPLKALVCHECFLVQLEEYVSPEAIFGDYAYFSSFSDSWVEHARNYTDAMVRRFKLGRQSLVMEIASNDGYLLQHFVEAGIPCLGIEPAANVAEVARKKGIPTVVEFLGLETARTIAARHGRPDLLAGNNVLAHVPDINDFVAGIRVLLSPTGVLTMEFPHLLRLMAGNQFDTIYHEHFSYLSLIAVERVFKRHGLVVFDVEELSTHGGSLRVYARHHEDSSRPVSGAVQALRDIEVRSGLTHLATYSEFEAKVHATKRDILQFLIDAKRAGKRIAGYGAPGKGNTLLNYCGIRTDFIDYTVDRSPYKQGRYTPGTHIPIRPIEVLRETRPDYVFILPWNLEREIIEQHGYIREWGGQFVIPIPSLRVVV